MFSFRRVLSTSVRYCKMLRDGLLQTCGPTYAMPPSTTFSAGPTSPPQDFNAQNGAESFSMAFLTELLDDPSLI